MTEEGPSKADINAVFKKLRSVASNKVCFDCGAKNPTWSSVTYGVFICIDCSAIHRGLGVHVSFVRSTQLDTNWTWLQLRAMQVGGNANATQFFRQHSCTTTDAQQKYKSRAAQLYKEKLHQQAVAAMRLHGYKLHIDGYHGEPLSPNSPNTKETPDFFEEHTKEDDDASMTRNESQTSISNEAYIITPSKKLAAANDCDELEGPRVDMITSDDAKTTSTSAKPVVIGQRRPGAKKTTQVGTKKGLGAQKLDANFSQIEKQAESIERANLQPVIQSDANKVDEISTGISARLMVREISDNVKKRDEQLKHSDPKKYEQIERLGMMGGKGGKSGVSHSVFGDMKPIEQEGDKKTTANFDSFAKSSRNAALDDDWEMINTEPSSKTSQDVRKRTDDFFDSFSSDLNSNKKETRNVGWSNDNDTRKKYSGATGGASTDEAVKKFGNAKAISSDQFFGDRGTDFETRSNFSRFEGSSAISSSDFFGNDDKTKSASRSSSGYALSTPDVGEIKDSVRQGVTKVAGKLSQFSNSVSSYISNYN